MELVQCRRYALQFSTIMLVARKAFYDLEFIQFDDSEPLPESASGDIPQPLGFKRRCSDPSSFYWPNELRRIRTCTARTRSASASIQ